MHEQADLFDILLKIFLQIWGYIVAGIFTMLLFIGKRQIKKFDEVMENYVHQDAHEKAITEIEERMLACQESLKEDQRLYFDQLRRNADEQIKQGEQLRALHKRFDRLFEMFVEYMKSQAKH